MRVLLDTNIIIHREASRVLNKDIGLLFNWLDKLAYTKYVHPLSVEEIKSHLDENVVETMTVKIANYNVLKTQSPETGAIQELRKEDKTKNDFIDTSLLKEVLNNRVDLLITEDRGIHRKAIKLGIPEKIYKIDSFIERVTAENPDLKDYKVLSVKKEFFGNINIKDEFFASFIEDYKEFETWFNRKADEISYVCSIDDAVKAFLYLKVENKGSESYNDISPKFEPKKRLKIGTFKVTSTGLKLGERFLKIIFDNALANKVDEIYVTIFDKREEQKRLISLLEEWGFSHWGQKTTSNGTESVFIKNFSRRLISSEPKLNFPFISFNHCKKFIVPIKPEYHTELFPDSILNNESPNDFVENEPHRNALRKIYISRSIDRSLKRGDLIVFYRTGGYYKSVVSTIGVVDSVVLNIKDERSFIELCRKRSVFSDSKLKEYWNYSPYNRPFIVNFLYIDSFPTPKVTLKTLMERSIIQSAPRGFELLSDKNFQQLLKVARANEDYFVY